MTIGIKLKYLDLWYYYLIPSRGRKGYKQIIPHNLKVSNRFRNLISWRDNVLASRLNTDGENNTPKQRVGSAIPLRLASVWPVVFGQINEHRSGLAFGQVFYFQIVVLAQTHQPAGNNYLCPTPPKNGIVVGLVPTNEIEAKILRRGICRTQAIFVDQTVTVVVQTITTQFCGGGNKFGRLNPNGSKLVSFTIGTFRNKQQRQEPENEQWPKHAAHSCPSRPPRPTFADRPVARYFHPQHCSRPALDTVRPDTARG